MSDYIAIFKKDKEEYILYDCDLSDDGLIIHWRGWTILNNNDDFRFNEEKRCNETGENSINIFDTLERIQ